MQNSHVPYPFSFLFRRESHEILTLGKPSKNKNYHVVRSTGCTCSRNTWKLTLIFFEWINQLIKCFWNGSSAVNMSSLEMTPDCFCFPKLCIQSSALWFSKNFASPITIYPLFWISYGNGYSEKNSFTSNLEMLLHQKMSFLSNISSMFLP